MAPCKKEDFGEMKLPCDSKTRTRKIVYYMQNKCDLNASGSISYPLPVQNLTCHCEPGSGFVGTNSTECAQCPAGYYSHGGELLSDWRNWNRSGTPGLDYSMDTYCSDFLSGKSCNAWRPSADNTYLISGEFKNSTLLRCFEQSMLVLIRKFLLPESENKISFEYKVDGANCRKGSESCSQGLHFYINGVQVLKKDTQFNWVKYESNIKPGVAKLKFVYHKSCTRDPILDVAYIRHISLVGVDSNLVPCSPCNPGSYATEKGARECTKCVQNEFQDEAGQSSCKQCPKDTFSRIGATSCSDLPACTNQDYYLKPDPINTCRKNGTSDDYIRPQKWYLPKWPGTSHMPCKKTKDLPAAKDVRCRCPSGKALTTTNPSRISCEACPLGTYSDGYMSSCQKCPAGQAAVPGFYFDLFADDKISSLFKQSCSGKYCHTNDNQYWLPRGSFMATRRIPGNFELGLMLEDITIDYYNAYLTLNCSLDCRIDGKRLAKHDHCTLNFALQRWNTSSNQYYTVREGDCVNQYRQYMRDGRVMKHTYPINEQGKYRLKALFHHEDEGNYSLLSYEARIHRIDIFGAKSGSAKSCIKCTAGTYLTNDGGFCRKCPNGTYSNEGSTHCTRCPGNMFADKEGSAQCTKCGEGTTSNANRDGCDYNGCRYQYDNDTLYDLSPLSVNGGPMYKVRTYRPKSKYFFPLYYYINICSLKHDNSSCTTMQRVDNMDNKVIRKSVIVKTMACKRWSFDEQNSYSIGEVLNFLPLKGNETNGLIIKLTGGYRCWNKLAKVYQVPATMIHMKCDMEADIGYPEPLDNNTAIDRNCLFAIQWRTKYACRICKKRDTREIKGVCVDGKQIITYIRSSGCRGENNQPSVTIKHRLCETQKMTKINTGGRNDTPLIVAIVIAVLVILILIFFLVYYARRNRYLRGRIFVPGKSFSKVQEEDEDELVDNMS